jgi:hypothetical protein
VALKIEARLLYCINFPALSSSIYAGMAKKVGGGGVKKKKERGR